MKLETRKILTIDVSKQEDCLILSGFQKECKENGYDMRVLIPLYPDSVSELSIIADKEVETYE